MSNLKTENKLLCMLVFFSISTGLWTNFKQLWLQDNNMNATEIGNLLSFGTLICIFGIILITKFLTLDKLKKFITASLFLKIITMILLFIFNHSSDILMIKILLVLDIILERLIILSIYPFLTMIVKNDNIYGKRKLIEYLFRDIGVLIGGVLIGQTLFGYLINYNACLAISIIFMFISPIFMITMENPKYEQKNQKQTGVINYILKDKILIIYCIQYLIGYIALQTCIGLKMLTLTNYIGFSDSLATNYVLIVGLVADVVGFMCLRFFTFKNDYINISIKLLIRFVAYTIAFISNDITISLIALTWSFVISTSYENRLDAPYINRVSNEYQLSYANIRQIFGIIGEAIGLFFCGTMYALGLRYMFGLSAFFMIFQISLAFYLIHLRHKEEKV